VTGTALLLLSEEPALVGLSERTALTGKGRREKNL